MPFIAMLDPRQPVHIAITDEAAGAALCGQVPVDGWLSVHESPSLPSHVAVCVGCLEASGNSPRRIPAPPQPPLPPFVPPEPVDETVAVSPPAPAVKDPD